jgi:hypothetical protein
VVAKGCNTHARVATAEAARSRRACCAPPGALGGMSYRRCQPPRHVEAPEAVERLPRRRGRRPERSVHRGSCRAGFKHRARDAGERADLRSTKSDGASSKSIVPLQLRERLRPVGPSGPRRPAPPSLFRVVQLRKPRAQMRRENANGCLSRSDRDGTTREPRVPRPAKRGEGKRKCAHGLMISRSR